MASGQSIEREGYRPTVRGEPADREDDGEVLKAAELVLLAHEQCVGKSIQAQSGHGLSVPVEPRSYAQLRANREDALQHLMAIRAHGRRGLAAKRMVLAVLITWLGSEDPNCAHAMTLLDEFEHVIWEGKNGSDPVLVALTANWVNQRTDAVSPTRYEADERGGYR